MKASEEKTIIVPEREYIIRKTPQTILDAYNKTEHVIGDATGTMTPGDTMVNVNLSYIASKIIENVGRFAEHYGSDMLYDWARVEAVLQPRAITEEEGYVFALGIRDYGIDHNEAIVANFRSSINPMGYIVTGDKYRKILAVGVKLTPCGNWRSSADVSVQLKDITHSFLRLAESDK